VVSLENSLISATLPAGAAPVSQDIAVSSTNAALAYTTSITGNPPWLAVTPSGTTPSSMRVTLNPAGLAPGDYASSIIVNANGSVNPPQTVSVNLTVVREETNVRQVLAQIADGAGWRTAITLVNTDNVSPHAFTLRFYPGVSTPSTRRLALAAPDTLVDSALTLRTIPAGGSVTIQTAGVDPDVWTGWAELIAPAAIGGTAIFRRQISFNQDGEGAVPIKPVSVNRFLLPFDNTQSFVTSMALVNTSSQDGSITVRFRDETGTTITVDEPTTFPLRARGHDAFELPRKFVKLAGRRGVAEFSSSTGELAALGLRFNDQPSARTFASFETRDPTVTAGSLTITHIADGGGWKTTMQLVNTGAGTARFTLRFFPGRNSPPGAPLRIEGRTLSNDLTLPEISIQPGGSIVLDTLGADAGQPWQGWGQITVNAGQIGGVAVFRQSAPGFPYQEGSVPIVAGGTSRFLLPFDNLAGFASTMAIVNATPSAADTVSVLLRFETGQAIPVPPGQATSVTLDARGHDAFILASRFARAGNVRGVAEFLSPAGQVFGLGLRFNDARRVFTSLPILRP
jgi:hypothetical protein